MKWWVSEIVWCGVVCGFVGCVLGVVLNMSGLLYRYVKLLVLCRCIVLLIMMLCSIVLLMLISGVCVSVLIVVLV